MLGQRLAIVGLLKSEIQSFEVPDVLSSGELVLRISHSLVSPGTEMLSYRSKGGGLPLYPGYTAVGVIERGLGVDPGLLGRAVFLFPAFTDQSHCHASHKVVRAGAIFVPLPDQLDPGKATFARLINVALTPFAHLPPRTRTTALVVGLGLVGNLVAQIAQLRGYMVIGVDPSEQRRASARVVGVQHTIDPVSECGMVEQVKYLTDGRGADLTVNATGSAATFMTSIEATASGGELSTLGGARGEAMVDLSKFLTHVQSRHVTVRCGWEMLLPRTPAHASSTVSTQENLQQAMRWLVDDVIKVGPLWSHAIKPSQLPETYDAFHHADPAYMGVVVDWR